MHIRVNWNTNASAPMLSISPLEKCNNVHENPIENEYAEEDDRAPPGVREAMQGRGQEGILLPAMS